MDELALQLLPQHLQGDVLQRHSDTEVEVVGQLERPEHAQPPTRVVLLLRVDVWGMERERRGARGVVERRVYQRSPPELVVVVLLADARESPPVQDVVPFHRRHRHVLLQDLHDADAPLQAHPLVSPQPYRAPAPTRPPTSPGPVPEPLAATDEDLERPPTTVIV